VAAYRRSFSTTARMVAAEASLKLGLGVANINSSQKKVNYFHYHIDNNHIDKNNSSHGKFITFYYKTSEFGRNFGIPTDSNIIPLILGLGGHNFFLTGYLSTGREFRKKRNDNFAPRRTVRLLCPSGALDDADPSTRNVTRV